MNTDWAIVEKGEVVTADYAGARFSNWRYGEKHLEGLKREAGPGLWDNYEVVEIPE